MKQNRDNNLMLFMIGIAICCALFLSFFVAMTEKVKASLIDPGVCTLFQAVAEAKSPAEKETIAKAEESQGGTATTAAAADTTTTTTPTADGGASVGVSIPKDQGSNYIQSGQKYYFNQYIQNIYGFAMKAAIALSILMLIYAGYKYMTSRGDSAAINEAKDILFSTLMGAALLMLVVLVGNIAGLATVNWGI